MRALIASGGTGGHFYPGYALARELAARGHESLFLLRKGDPAGPRLDALGLPWTELDLSGLPRRPSKAWLTLPVRTARGLWTVRAIVRAWQPDVVVGMGGYLTLPAALAGRLRGVPVVLHESNAVLGLANRLCRPLSDALALGLPSAEGTKGVLTGTPLRPELLERGEAEPARRGLGLDPALTTVLVLGGSQGARALNRLAAPALAAARASVGTLQALHLAGKDGETEARAAYAAAQVPAVVLSYLDGMDRAYAASELAVCRAGASTLAELAAQRLPALLVPYPHAAGDHQDANARVLESAGAALRLPEAGLDAARLGAAAASVLGSTEKRRAMADAYASLGLPPARDSARLLADLVEKAAKRAI
ncbi:UDP-N-acetylglucosamine--N-acetylmuramyl-(pentapeptide) pyrophosphoryl-undecaprenol N-acetylglucosamine transferase [bacterium]|nr:MAG: UDP-N-acetylglucosamine--N-acetylmuramyl-(pentapeptide) pyrophosphoryl-undecaprenol N-acetylglucosamine transferase [bacterium]